jgi:predicted nuclease with RNAse H fold
MREAECEIRARGMSVYPTSKESPNSWKALVTAFRPVWPQLGRLTTVIETYPYAIWLQLTAPTGTPVPWPWKQVKNDTYDALLCAHLAELHHLGRTQSLGRASEGQIVIPS